MNDLDAFLAQIGKIRDAFRIAFADEDDERRFIDDAFLRRDVPILGTCLAAIRRPTSRSIENIPMSAGAP